MATCIRHAQGRRPLGRVAAGAGSGYVEPDSIIERPVMTHRPPIRAVLWDIDGTLLDSEPHHHSATLAVCRSHGYELSAEDGARFLGCGFPEFYASLDARSPMPVPFRAWVDAITDRYLEGIAGVTPREGAYALVAAFAGLGLRQACVSNSGRRVVEANLRAIALPHLEFAVSRDDVSNGKPDPEGYRLAAHRLGVPPEACAAIEDSPTGARAAKAAGMLTIAWPQHPQLVFDAVDHRVDHLHEVDWHGLCGNRA